MAVVFNVSTHFDLGLKFAFDNLLGKIPPGGSRTDARSLALILNFRS
jgi:hypothetical protein